MVESEELSTNWSSLEPVTPGNIYFPNKTQRLLAERHPNRAAMVHTAGEPGLRPERKFRPCLVVPGFSFLLLIEAVSVEELRPLVP
jgi:hypothetical protein